MRFQKQMRFFKNPLPDARRGIAPGGVDLSCLTAGESMLCQPLGHALAVGRVGARHRDQVFHRYVRGDLAVAHALLYGFGNLVHQRQSPRYPTDAAIKPACQILQAVAETLLQFGQQPALLQRRLAFGKTHRAVQHQRVGFAHVPDDGVHGVAAQLL